MLEACEIERQDFLQLQEALEAEKVQSEEEHCQAISALEAMHAAQAAELVSSAAKSCSPCNFSHIKWSCLTVFGRKWEIGQPDSWTVQMHTR